MSSAPSKSLFGTLLWLAIALCLNVFCLSPFVLAYIVYTGSYHEYTHEATHIEGEYVVELTAPGERTYVPALISESQVVTAMSCQRFQLGDATVTVGTVEKTYGKVFCQNAVYQTTFASSLTAFEGDTITWVVLVSDSPFSIVRLAEPNIGYAILSILLVIGGFIATIIVNLTLLNRI